jgi:hypothetical protein
MEPSVSVCRRCGYSGHRHRTSADASCQSVSATLLELVSRGFPREQTYACRLRSLKLRISRTRGAGARSAAVSACCGDHCLRAGLSCSRTTAKRSRPTKMVASCLVPGFATESLASGSTAPRSWGGACGRDQRSSAHSSVPACERSRRFQPQTPGRT